MSRWGTSLRQVVQTLEGDRRLANVFEPLQTLMGDRRTAKRGFSNPAVFFAQWGCLLKHFRNCGTHDGALDEMPPETLAQFCYS